MAALAALDALVVLAAAHRNCNDSKTMVASAALGPLPLSLGLDWAGSYEKVLLFSIAMPVICAISAYIAKPPVTHTKNI